MHISKIEASEYEYECADGCCYECGVFLIVEIDGVEYAVIGHNLDDALGMVFEKYVKWMSTEGED